MAVISIKVKSFLKQLKTTEQASAEECQKAAMLLNQALDGKKIYILQKKSDIKDAANDIHIARSRLEDIHDRLALAIRSGIVSDSIH